MTLPRGLLRILTLRCEEASALASRSLDEPLSIAERLALAGHLLACASCRRFRRQIGLLRDAARFPGSPRPEPAVLSPAARSRIATALAEAIDRPEPPAPTE